MSGVYNLPLVAGGDISGGMPVFTTYGLKGLAYSLTSGSGRIVVPEGVSLITDLFAVGAGGGGGSGAVSTSTSTTVGGVQSGGGGGGGAAMRLQNVPVIPGEVIYYSIGTGGFGASGGSLTSSTTNSSNGSSGSSGAPTYLIINGNYFILNGGNGGSAGGTSNAANSSGGAGGTLVQTGSTPTGATLTSINGGDGAASAATDNSPTAVNAGTGTNVFTLGLQNIGSTLSYSQGYYSQYLTSTTALSTTASGTTITSPSTQSATFAVAATMVRSALAAGEFSDLTKNWVINYTVSAMTTPYEMRLKLQRRNSAGTMQTESSYGQTVSATGTYTDTISWAPGTWSANDQLALVWEHRRPSGAGNKSATITAGGASYISAPDPSILVGTIGTVGSTGFVGGGGTGPSQSTVIGTTYAGGNAGLGGGAADQILYIASRGITGTGAGTAGANTGAGGAGSAPVFSHTVSTSVTVSSGPGGNGADGYVALVFN